ncbi:unnamed protein product [Clonostachys rhizophaga]|uniref:Lipocalin-like domain-containing protein n=1 Tax=Clonostachys rhizophaga TaxID=160324 RepID=A0A9N9VDP2_9HYPO|nr:unnamed protein product [Clonostachys rhizophaga]
MADLQRALIGTWKVLTYDMTISSEKGTSTIQPAGKNPLGYVTFTQDGYMSVHMTSSEAIVPHKSDMWYQATDEEVVRAARAMLTYCGPFKVTEEAGEYLISTAVDVSLDPNWIGGDQVRKVAIEEQDGRPLLILRPVQTFTFENGDTAEVIVSWEKILPKEIK